MMQRILVGIAAGIAAALMFLAPVGGTALAFPLFLLTGLPIGVAGLGWGTAAGAIAAVVGTLTIFAILSTVGAASFVLLFAAPIFWAARLALLSRPVGDEASADRREWYPLGRMLVHLAAAAAIGVVLVGVLIGFDRAALTTDVTQALVEWFAAVQTTGTPPTAAELEPFVHFNLAVMPVTMPVILLVLLGFDLWLAAIVTRASGRLQRPREKLWGIELPNRALIALAGVTALAFLPGAAGEIARVFAGALAGAAALTGLAVMHALTAGLSGRAVLLSVVYALMAFSGLPLILFVLLAVGEALFHLRARRFKGAPPT
jgi:hypothetical protein